MKKKQRRKTQNVAKATTKPKGFVKRSQRRDN